MSTSGISILVVDDEDMVRLNLVAFLEDEGFDVCSANSGEEALRMLEEQKVDVGIIDMRLPGMDGNTLILKAHERYPGLKFLIHTGSTNSTLPEVLKEIGIRNRYVFQKPVVDINVMINAIQSLMDK